LKVEVNEEPRKKKSALTDREFCTWKYCGGNDNIKREREVDKFVVV
jgi:hypothetical protein